MNKYELEYSKFLADISQKVSDFIKSNYFYEDINKNSVYSSVPETEEIQTDTVNEFTNVDNKKVELVEYVPETQYNIPEILKNKKLWYVIGAIFLYKLLKK